MALADPVTLMKEENISSSQSIGVSGQRNQHFPNPRGVIIGNNPLNYVISSQNPNPSPPAINLQNFDVFLHNKDVGNDSPNYSSTITTTSNGKCSVFNEVASAKTVIPHFSGPQSNSKSSFTSACNVKPSKTGAIDNKMGDCSHTVSSGVLQKKDSLFVCPVCNEALKTKRSFNSHILVHCQLVKSPVSSNKRFSPSEANGQSPSKKNGASQMRLNESFIRNGLKNENSSIPLDLSCKKGLEISGRPPWVGTMQTSIHDEINDGTCLQLSSSMRDSSSPIPPLLKMVTTEKESDAMMMDRSPFEDENENLMNEAKEQEDAFFNSMENEAFLSDDSLYMEQRPPLPLLKSVGITKKLKVWSEDGSPMVYSIKVHAEQIVASRILGINEETGDKIELYKCFMCNISFPSVTRLQAHLLIHKQKFQCRKCDFLTDSRIQFSQHVQKEHSVKDTVKAKVDVIQQSRDDVLNAENTVTVAALLSALHGNSVNSNSVQMDVEARSDTLEESGPQSNSSSPNSPQDFYSGHYDSGANRDIFKMYSCRFCGKKFDRAFSCNRHERVHTGYKPCFCRICGRGFSEPRNLRHHVIRFHSDGSLRHLIKRDRRKKKDDDNSSSSDSSIKDSIGDGVNEASNPNSILGSLLMLSRPEELNGSNSNSSSFANSENYSDATVAVSDYTSNLTKIFAASLDKSQGKISDCVFQGRPSTDEDYSNVERLDLPEDSDVKPIESLQMTRTCESTEPLEPGEIRFSSRFKVVDCEGKGRRVIMEENQGPDDRSPQFSTYAPRLNIVQDPVNREKVLIPLTDDIGRSFYECPYCLKFFGSTSDLNRHLDFHEDLRPYDCQYCDYSARTNSQLKVHKMRHEGIKQFNCDVCNYNGVTQSDLNRHKKTQSHVARSQNICTVCGLGFYSASQKQVHVSNCHPEMEGASSLLQMSMGGVASREEALEKDDKNSPSNTVCSVTNFPIPCALAREAD